MRRGSMGRLVGFLLAAAASAARNETSQPHIVLAIVDDLGYGDVGYNNRELHAATPTMNKLASGGVTLTSFYASPTCTASRAALFTGKYPMHLGLQDSVIHPSEPRGVPQEDKRAATAGAAAKVGHLRRLEPGQQPQSYAETALDDVLSHEHLTDSLDGVDQWDAFVSGASAAASQRTHVAHNINSELFGAAGALRVGEYKLIVEARVTESEIYEYGQHMLQDDNWDQSELSQVIHQKLLRTPGTTSLFDVVANPNELDEEDCDDARSCRNLYDLDEFADVKATILEKWAELRDSTPESTEIWLDDGPLADPALFGGVWTPWRDDLGMPYATYQLATKTVHNTLGGDNKPKPAEAAEASAEQTNAGHNRRLAESRGGGVSAATLALGAVLGYAGAQLRR